MSALITHPTVRSMLRGVLVWAPLWISTTVSFGVLGVGYVLFIKQDTYLASQALLVRDEANGAVMRLGRFQSQTEMKAAQETILEMSKSQQVVRDALIATKKPSDGTGWFSWGEYPSKELVEEVAKNGISVHAPKGTEFGVTEVIYVDIKSSSQTEAVTMNKALCDALEARLQQVRKARADGVISELEHARESAKRDLALSTSSLHEMESQAGSDLSDLRGMTDSIAGGATSRAEFDQIKGEIRQAESNRYALTADREMLQRACEDPSSFIVAPGAVLNSQPGLKRLREGLVDAQLNGSQLAGKFTDSHPLVNASQSAQSAIVRRFVQELKASISSVESDIHLADRKLEELESKKRGAELRLVRLADGRASYANILSEVKSKLAMVEGAERELAEAHAARDSSVSTSLITRLDAPIVSDRPIGPGRTTIAGLCTIAGLVFGLGIVFVIIPIDAGPSFGRRSADRFRSRRGVGREDALESDPMADEPKARQPVNQPTRPQTQSAVDRPNVEKVSTEKAAAVLSTTNNSVQTLANSIAELSSEIEMQDAYQPLLRARPSKPKTEPRSSPSNPLVGNVTPTSPVASGVVQEASLSGTEVSVDFAFQELARLRAKKPSSRSEELQVQLKLQEIKSFLGEERFEGSKGSISEATDPPKIKPRSTKLN
jgi:polysaccharide biosynthesis transport protein